MFYQSGKFDCTTMTMHECITHCAGTRALRSEYREQNVTEPEWLSDQHLRLERRVRDLRHDEKAHELAKLVTLIAQHQPAEAKLEGWEAQRDALKAELTNA